MSHTYVDTSRLKNIYLKENQNDNIDDDSMKANSEINTYEGEEEEEEYLDVDDEENDQNIDANDDDYLRDIYLLSDFPFTISIYNITLGQYAQKFFQV